jgi:hypothetical protein
MDLLGGVIAQLVGERASRDPDDVEVRTFAAAVLTIVVLAWLGASGDLEKFLQELERGTALLEAGLRL